MKQPKCPWCGMGFRGDQSDSWHVEGFREEGRCGSQWFPDFEGGHAEGRKQSEACREIVRLKIAHLRRMAEACEALESRALAFAFPDPAVGWTDDRYWKIIGRVDRFRTACLAKIIELKGLQCSTKF